MLLLVCLARIVGAVFPRFFDSHGEMLELTWPMRLYMGMAGLLGLGPLLFGKNGAILYPVFFVVASVVAFSPLTWLFQRQPKSDNGHSKTGEELASFALLIAGPQTFVQLLSLYSVAASSVPLFWLWAVPLILASLLVLWHLAYCLLIRRPLNAPVLVGGLLLLLVLGYLGRKGIIEHYGVPVPGSFWEAREYTTEAIAQMKPYGDDGKTGLRFRARVGIKVGSRFDSDTDNEGIEHFYSVREAQILWFEVLGIQRRIIQQEGTLYLDAESDAVVVRDHLGKSYQIESGLDFTAARKS